jgi:hypothetical protein
MEIKLVKSTFKGIQSAESSGVTWVLHGAEGFPIQVFREYYGQMCELRVYDKSTRKVVAKFPYSLKEVRDGVAPLLFDFLAEQVAIAAHTDNEDENG